MQENPPKTTRPVHPVVRALETGTFLELMRDLLDPGDWAVDIEAGFWWVPYRLRHDVEVVEAEGVRSCRSTFVLSTEIEDELNAMAKCDYLNQRALGGAAWFDFNDRSIKFTSTVRLDPANWFGAFLFSQTVPRLVGQLENFAPTLAKLAGGKVPDIEHPTLGKRSTPDQFLADALLATEQPEAACGLWWSGREIEAFRRAVRFLIQQSDTPDVADQIDPVTYDDECTSAQNLELDVIWESELEDRWTSLKIAEGRHPEYGHGIEFIISTSMVFGEDLDDGGPPTSHPMALLVANYMNMNQHFSCSARFGLGAWMTWRGQLVHETFLYPELVSIVQYLAGAHAGEVLALLGGQISDHSRMLSKHLDPIQNFAGDPIHIAESRWDGVRRNAGLHPMFGPADELFRDMYSTYPMNRLIEPVELDRNSFGLATETTLATMGIFNPAGPTVGSIEVAINYRIGAALLIERARHPHYPTARVHAVLDRNGFNRLDELLAGTVAQLPWSTFDWWDTRESLKPDVEAMKRGLRSFAHAHPDNDYQALALGLIENLDDPWDRVAQDFVPTIAVPAGYHDPIDLWIDALTHPANIDNHYAFIRSAWEGATEWLAAAREGDEAGMAHRAQFEADRSRWNVWRRRNPELDLPG